MTCTGYCSSKGAPTRRCGEASLWKTKYVAKSSAAYFRYPSPWSSFLNSGLKSRYRRFDSGVSDGICKPSQALQALGC